MGTSEGMERAIDAQADMKWRVVVLTDDGEADVTARLLWVTLCDEACSGGDGSWLELFYQRADPRAPFEWWSFRDIALRVFCRGVLIGHYQLDQIRWDHESGFVRITAKVDDATGEGSISSP